MKEEKNIAILLILVLVFGGIPALIECFDGVLLIIQSFFPLFTHIAKKSIEDYLTSPYFIVSVIMMFLSAGGVWLGKRKGKILYIIVSILCFIFSAVSIGSNIF